LQKRLGNGNENYIYNNSIRGKLHIK